MLSLIIDTSTDENFIAICEAGHISQYLIIPPPKQSKRLTHELKKLIESSQLSLNVFSAIGIGIGPGSFSGTRVGVMIAKSLSYALHIPLIPFCSLEAYIPETEGSFTVAVDAKSHSYYCLEGVKEGKNIRYPHPPRLCREDELLTASPLISPHDHHALASDIWKKVPFNLSHIASLVYQRWRGGFAKRHDEVKICYLKSP